MPYLTVNQLIFCHSALITYRIRETRDGRSGRIIVTNTRLTLAKNSYCYRGAAQWNSMPEYIRNLKKIDQFKFQLRK